MSEEITNNGVTTESKEQTKSNADYEAEIAQLQDMLAKQKLATDNASKDASEWKKKYRDTQSDQERQASEIAEKQAQMEAQLKDYQTRERISNYQTQLISVGYDVETAKIMAEALPEGIGADFFQKQKEFLDNKTQQITANALKEQPSLSNGKPVSSSDMPDKDVEAFRKAA